MLYIKNATIINCDITIENQAILIKDGYIVEIGPTQVLTPPPEAQVIDAGGLNLVPGFIDLQ
ncbi:MAG: N-acetylglucosamine-6-phosphate deacetylase, partial [Chloroflexota bacterium]